MTILGRTFLAIYSLLFIAACAGLAGLLWNDSEMIDLSLGDLNFQAFFVPGAEDAQKWAFTALMAAFVLLGVVTLLLAFMRSSPSGGRLRLRQADGGTVEVGAETIESLLKEELEQLPQVRQATTKVRVNGTAIDSVLTLVVEPSTSIAQITNEAAHVTARALREQVGAANVRRPTVKISYDEIAARPVGGVAPRPRPQHMPPPSPPPDATIVDAPLPSRMAREPLFPTRDQTEGTWTDAPEPGEPRGPLEWREDEPLPAESDERAPDDQR